MKTFMTALMCLLAIGTMQAQNKENQIQNINNAYARAQERRANDGKGENQRKCLILVLYDNGGYAGQDITDLVHIYFYEDHTMAEDGALQVNNKPYLILRDFSHDGFSIHQEYLFEINPTDEWREDPLIYAVDREERNGTVNEKRYYWANEKLIKYELSDPNEYSEDESTKEDGMRYYEMFNAAFADISSRYY